MSESNPNALCTTNGNECTSIGSVCNNEQERYWVLTAIQNVIGLTERYRARHLARKLPILIPSRSIDTLSDRGYYERRVVTQILNPKHSARVLDGLPRPERIHQFRCPLRPNPGRFRVQDIRTTSAAIVVKSERVDGVGFGSALWQQSWTWFVMFATRQVAEDTCTSLDWRVCEVDKSKEI